ncbi:putative lipid-binding transport protein (Tim44 family) [Marinomonas alcarazii]|uniref:Putative lipid-binding transport protein (Tim44 family) n=1 Tax=Marinomonas alcarazii TaxID=491949 RepID=A0A318V7L7_9GAMM|nr:Tim44-like domain-containing protein [Marinomonas alcarazii]PYF84083.1 putative lipid-binding transport protein (Tim44 family) [Marinomonas alcarazii]
MKTTVFAMLMAFVLAIGAGGYSADVQAKKFGGGKSFGKSFSISKPKSTTNSTAGTTNTTAGAKKPGFLGGMGGGLLGGLLAGGIFAALLGSGAFDGISFGDILLFALIGFLVYKFFIAPKRRAAQANAAGANGMFREMPNSTRDGSQPSPMSGISGFGSQPAIQLPPGFNEQAFVAEAKNHYITLQKAWDDNNFDEILDYVSPELYNLLVTERASYGNDKPRTEVVSLMVEIVRGEYIGSIASISLQFSGWIKEGDQTSETNEIWHLEKNMSDANGNWTIVGIQQDN